ncbi:MAG: hypothetical protein M1838_002574 [Thelocarpon superellum]|nr:MAG: hypothetical protein M1838_002574 [Thelocarpon superellum]
MKFTILASFLALTTFATADLTWNVETNCNAGSDMCTFEHMIGLCGKGQTCMQALLTKLQSMNQAQKFGQNDKIACVGRNNLVGELCIVGSHFQVRHDHVTVKAAANITQSLIDAACTTCGSATVTQSRIGPDPSNLARNASAFVSRKVISVDYYAEIFHG